jgi:hypothetical protein
MVVYSFYIFDRHGTHPLRHSNDCKCADLAAECIYNKRWLPPSTSSSGRGSRPSSQAIVNGGPQPRAALSAEDDAKLIFGTVFSLRNMVRKLGGEDDRFVERFLFILVHGFGLND